MSDRDSHKIQEVASQVPTNVEERAIDLSLTTDVVIAGATVVNAAATIYNATQSGKPTESPPPEQQEIELPPGVDRE